LEVRIEFNSGNPWGNIGYGISDSNGDVYGKVPANEPLSIRVYSECGDVLFETNVGPFATDTSLGTLTVPTVGLAITTFNGTLLDCNGNLLDDGIVVISEGDVNYYHYLSSATFSYSRITCGQSALSVKGINVTDLVESSEVSATHGIVNELGNISVCGQQLQNYISITFDGNTAVFLNAHYDSWNQGGQSSTNLYSQDSINIDDVLYISFAGVTPGDYSTSNFFEVIRYTAYDWDLSPNNPVGNGGFTSFEVTEYGPNLIGTFSGELTNTVTGVTANCTGEFNLTQ